jgi:hypothetical protein
MLLLLLLLLLVVVVMMIICFRYDQRSAQFQTIIVSATVMFAALCTVIIEGESYGANFLFRISTDRSIIVFIDM